LNKIIIIAAPSGSGKTTIVKQLLAHLPQLKFSISACTRQPRAGEVEGKDYYFISVDAFEQHISQNDFVEWEMVYAGKYYGTLKSEMERIWQGNQCPLIDIDVMGALNVKQQYGTQALALFIQAPSIEILEQRLKQRGTETPESLQERVNKASHELTYADQFDAVVVNDVLEVAVEEVLQKVRTFMAIH
jgi:guanylate kinase